MIELIIAMAIGMIILVGVGSLYLSSSGVSRLASSAGSAEDSGRLMMFMIGDGIKAAGYGEVVGAGFGRGGETFFEGPAVRGCSGARMADPFNPITPDYSCVGVAPGDQIFVRFQSRHRAAAMSAAERDAAQMRDCLGSPLNQDVLLLDPNNPGTGTTVQMVQNSFAMNAAGNALLCEGVSNVGTPAPIVPNVVDFRIYYRFDDAAWALAAGMQTNVVPTGGSIRDAAWIIATGVASPADPWQYVLGAIVCMTVATGERGVATATNVTRCPATVAEAVAATPVTEVSTTGQLRRTFMEIFTIKSRATHSPAISPI
ncbi:MAG: hypothetical protein ACXWVT_13405 [Burkholderiaceae bacterium]